MKKGSEGITFEHPAAYWCGIAAITVGVLLHIRIFLAAADMGYAVSRMPMASAAMFFGMALIVAGIALTVVGLVPRRSRETTDISHIRVKALDEAKIRGPHLVMLIVMAFAVTIDVMKPITIGFVVPGMTKEYGLKSTLNPTGHVPVAWFPLSAVCGLVLGSFVWGWLGDRIGRRASILLSGVIFISTAICGAMPAFGWNVLMCFFMGLGVGGMLPIAFALMSETIPARHRGWLMVLIGGDVAGAFILTSALAAWLTPHFGWRILWLIGLPTGLALVLLNRWIPESPRFLLSRGRSAEARQVMSRFGATVVELDHSELEIEEGVKARFRQLFEGPFKGLSWVVILFGLGCGLVTFGFQLWIPTNLQKLGFSAVTSDRILRDSALLGFPATFVIAWLYGVWSSKKTLILLGLLTAASLFGFVVAGNGIAQNRALLYGLLVVPITGISSILAVLIAYGSEIYPTRIRSRGTGLAGAAAKAGGILVIAVVVAGVAAPGISLTALIGAVPMLLAVLAVVRWGLETRKRGLEEITQEELAGEAVSVG